MGRHVVAGVDGSDSAALALDWAAADAGRRGLALRVVYVREPWAGEWVTSEGYDSLTVQVERLLERSAARARERARDLEVTTAMVTGAVVERLRTETETADTVVIGSRGLGGFAGLVLGSTGLGLANQAHGPVVVVRGHYRVSHDEVVVGYDGSVDAECAVEYAMEQAQARGARLRVLHAKHQPVSYPHPAGFGPVPPPGIEDEIPQRLRPWLDKYPRVRSVQTVVSKHPVPALAAASRTADLVVVGTRGMSGFTSTMLGSVSHGVLHHAHCPVAVVRPREARS
ncbi:MULTISPECIES: universal stress protein [Nonomuraea]|uniref:Universal stress protein n=3 Tax=Nonomuraea TaxID=83681 RepID=A0ABW1BPR6_9ACTN|nr:universal stress protein [Nonomuraea harbinensis]